MEFVDINCPSCNATIHVNSSLKSCFCNNCGAKIALDEDHNVISYVDKDAPEPVVKKHTEEEDRIEFERRMRESQRDDDDHIRQQQEDDRLYQEMLDSIEIPSKFGDSKVYGIWFLYFLLFAAIGGLSKNTFWTELGFLVFAIPSAIHLINSYKRHKEIMKDVDAYLDEQVQLRYYDNNFAIGDPVKECKHCKKLIHADAKVCPYCRKKQRRYWPVVILVLLILLLAGTKARTDKDSLTSGSTSKNTTTSSTSNSYVKPKTSSTTTSDTTSQKTTATTTPAVEEKPYIVANFATPITAYEDDKITIILTAVNVEKSEVEAVYEVTNRTSTDYSIAAHSYSLNSFMLGDSKYGFGSVDLPGEKKAKLVVSYPKSKLDFIGQDSVEELETIFWVYGETMKEYDTGLVKIQSNTYSSGNMPSFDASKAVYDDEYISVWTISKVADDEYGFLIHNKTDYNCSFTVDNASVNEWGYDLTDYTFDLFEELIHADSYMLFGFPVKQSFMNENNIDKVESIEFTIKLEDDYYKSYKTKFEKMTGKIVADVSNF